MRELYETRQDLVTRVSSFGAEIPTTSMHWKRVGHDLESIVRQMSWAPPWTPCDPRGFLGERPSLLRERKRDVDDAAEHVPAEATTLPASVEVADADSHSESDAESSQGVHETSAAREEDNQEAWQLSSVKAWTSLVRLGPARVAPSHRDVFGDSPRCMLLKMRMATVGYQRLGLH